LIIEEKSFFRMQVHLRVDRWNGKGYATQPALPTR
jgi:hypothetical protein